MIDTSRLGIDYGVLLPELVVTATARHHDGSIVPGSPLTFVVEFLP